MLELEVLFIKNAELKTLVIAFQNKGGPTFSVFGYPVLHLGNDPAKRKVFVDIGLQIFECFELGVAKIPQFIFVIVERMSGDVNAHYFFFFGQFFHGVPIFTRRDNGFGNLHIAGLAKQTHLRRIFVFLKLIAVANGLLQKGNSVAFVMKILGSRGAYKGVKPAG